MRFFPVTLIAFLCLAGCSKNHHSPVAPLPGTAMLLVRTHPGSATVRIDSLAVPEASPVYVRTTRGDHSVVCTLAGYADTTLFVHVTSDSDSIEVVFRPLPGTPRSVTSWPTLDHARQFGVGPDGNVYIDMGRSESGRMDIFSANGEFLTSWPVGTPATGPMHIDGSNHVYFGTQKLSSTGQFLYALSAPAYNWILGQTVGPGDSVYTTYVPAGMFVYGPSNGTPVRQVALQKEVAVGPGGRLYYCRAPFGAPCQIVMCSAAGDSITAWPITYRGDLEFGPEGDLYVLEPGYDALKSPGLIEKYSPDGALLARWAVENRDLLREPLRFAVGPALDVFILSSSGDRMFRWSN